MYLFFLRKKKLPTQMKHETFFFLSCVVEFGGESIEIFFLCYFNRKYIEWIIYRVLDTLFVLVLLTRSTIFNISSNFYFNTLIQVIFFSHKIGCKERE